MIVKWIQSVAQGAGRAETTAQAAEKHRREKKESRLVDVAHEVMRRDQANLEGLVRMGWPNVQREQFKGKVRRKVWDVISDELGTVDQEMVEEITERVVDAAEFDTRYRKLFSPEEER